MCMCRQACILTVQAIYYIEVIIQLVLSRSFIAQIANGPLAQWAGLCVGHICDRGFDSQLPSYFLEYFHIFLKHNY